jgi:polyisoprenyl-phosphate glycosyltransferase
MDLSVVIPVYNEENAARETILEIINELEKLNIQYEIIIVDDNSTDSSIDSIKDLNIKIIRHKLNRGGGAARITGMRYAEGDIILQTDADGTYPCDKIGKFWQEMKNHDMIIGARKQEKAKGFRPLRILIKWIINKFASYLSNTKIIDLNTGFRAYRKDVAMKYVYLFPNTHSIMSTMTLAFIMDKYRVKFIEIGYRERIGKSSFHPIRDTYNYLLATIRAITNFSPFRITSKISLILFIASIGSLIRDLILKNLADTSILLILVTLIVFIFGILFDQIVTVRKCFELEIATLKSMVDHKSDKETIENDPNIEIIK